MPFAGVDDLEPRLAPRGEEFAIGFNRAAKLQDIIPDPGKPISDDKRKEFMDAVIASKETSQVLRKQIADRYPAVNGRKAPISPIEVELEARPVSEKEIKKMDPPFRRLH